MTALILLALTAYLLGLRALVRAHRAWQDGPLDPQVADWLDRIAAVENDPGTVAALDDYRAAQARIPDIPTTSKEVA